MTDSDYITIAADEFRFGTDGEPIDELALVVTANAWHGGQWSALYSYTSTGAIRDDLADEVRDAMAHADGDDRDALAGLLAHVLATGERGPQSPWSPRW